jgi:catechol 2,3-dioxygenase-like lactoylglutathione lyase family enzyme
MSAHFKLSRRDLLLSLPALSVARKVLAQTGATLKIRALNHMTIAVTDPKRTIDFYQTLFGMPVQARQGPGTTVLRVGPGPQFMAVGAVGAGQTPSITHYCVTVEDFSVDRVLKVLADHGITKADATSGLSGGPMKVRVRMRGPEVGGAKEGTPELYVGDPDGIVVQIQDPKYGGGAGVLGDVLKVEPSPAKGLIPLEDYSHFTISEQDSTKSNKFYRDLFGMGFRSYQGPTAPTLAIGPGVQFVMVTGGGGGARAGAPPAPPRPASINHVSFAMKNFNVEAVQKALESVGIKPRAGNGPAGPMQHYISLRMENRGGAKEGTPELYFTDPDGILVQIQDITYCGGGGYLGNVCPPL